MSGVNKVIIVGRLGKDPETREVGSSSVCNFSVATSEKWTDKSGESKEKTEWHNITAWGKTGELAAKYLNKGSEVYVEGKLQTDSYEKDGVKQYSTKIVANSIQFIGGRKTDNSDAPF